MSETLPNVVVIGAMKSGTTALHRYLDHHPQIGMTSLKETNFFTGPTEAPHADAESWWRTGQWHRGLDWYRSLFDARAPIRGETSPGYTSPDHPEVAARMASVLPDARLVYLVRDPVERAVSQYDHHRREGTEERSLESAVLDHNSQYVARGRYFDRLRPFLEHFPREQILVVVQERLLVDRRRELGRVYQHVGADGRWWDDGLEQRWHVGDGRTDVPARLRSAVAELVADDRARLCDLIGDALPEWDTGV